MTRGWIARLAAECARHRALLSITLTVTAIGVAVDLSVPLSDVETAVIRSALHKWKVVFFRDQTLDHAAQIAFGARALTSFIRGTLTSEGKVMS